MMRNGNIVLIVVDALRRDAIDFMPFLSTFLSKCILFKDPYSVTNATDPSLTSMLTGFYPSTHGVIQHGERVELRHLSALSGVTFLQEVLKSAGFATFAIDFLDRWHVRGFDTYRYPERALVRLRRFVAKKLPRSVRNILKNLLRGRRSEDKRMALPYRAKDAVDMAIRVLKSIKGSRRFFLFIHFWDTHFPYEVAENTGSSLIAEDLRVSDLGRYVHGYWFEMLVKHFGEDTPVELVKQRYIAAAKFVDSQIKRLIEFLDEERLLDETIVIVTSDHGESLGEHGIWFDHHGLYEQSIRVPLAIYVPGFSSRVIEGFVQHVDIVPTLLSLLGLRDRIDPLTDGLDLSRSLEEGVKADRDTMFFEEAYTERKFAIRKGRYKYIAALNRDDAVCRYCGKIHGGIEELYDLEKDPEETNNLVDQLPDIAKEMRVELLKVLHDLRRKNLRLRLRRVRATIGNTSIHREHLY